MKPKQKKNKIESKIASKNKKRKKNAFSKKESNIDK